MASDLVDSGTLEVDPQVVHDDGSSFVDVTEELDSYTTSCTPSITRYPFENGRRYHAFKSGAYPLPNDDAELERLNLVHHMLKKALGDKLHLAPSQHAQRVLDLGTGTGCWAEDFAEKNPQADVIGNDLSPVQPSWVPPNLRFEVDDIESGWAFGTPFDFIFCRTMLFAISDWPKLVKQAYNNLKPGAWVEFQDWDTGFYSEDESCNPSSHTAKFMRLLNDASRRLGKEPSPGPKLEQWVTDAGFRNVTHRKFKLPVGPWPKSQQQKEIGTFNLTQVVEGLEAYSMRLFTSALGWQPEEVEVFCAHVRAELKDQRSAHRLVDYHVVYAQRPET
ncbi:S-adenosyl-L-methionine-dependent methyltransferase [Lophiotrema nucula]|uniref:S-adenosyl-L-methionine-dependent methyltransferase n=1 Tax=Lophiotrema nucula TaxID=690887 RepID=A0A6A5YME1_9PLEO|nr:S-adenosyl-L-methionine-dependent methyltransferase [Lophiotrema nucula]